MMQAELQREIEAMLERLVPVPAFRSLLRGFVQDKAQEATSWGAATEHVHFMLGGASPHLPQLAALTEWLVLALDIADDLQDRDNMEKSWMQCPSELSLNAVMGLLMGAISELGRLRLEHPEAALPDPGEVAQIVMHAVNGQYRDLVNDIATEQDYIAVVQQKSCMLLKLAYYMGYSAVDPRPPVDEAMELLAGYAGVVSQLANDMRDICRVDVKNDLLHRKLTLPILFLLADEEGSPTYIRDYYSGELDQEAFLTYKPAVLDYIRDSGCLEYTQVIQNLFLQKAEETLDQIPAVDPVWKQRFRELVIGKPVLEEERA